MNLMLIGHCHPVRAAQQEGIRPVVEAAEAAAWDPEGLLPQMGSTTGGHFERRAAERAARLVAADAETGQQSILGNEDATRAAPSLRPQSAPQQYFTPTSAIPESSLRCAGFAGIYIPTHWHPCPRMQHLEMRAFLYAVVCMS
jgi:hypothetical protein